MTQPSAPGASGTGFNASNLSNDELLQLIASLDRPGSVSATPLAPPQGSQGPGPEGEALNAQILAGLNGQQLDDLVRGSTPPGMDALKSVPTGLKEGVASLLGTPGDLQNVWGRGVDWAAQKGIGGLQDLTGQSLGAPYMGGGKKPELTDYAKMNGALTSADANKAIQQVSGDYYKPVTKAGRYAEAISSFAPAALAPGGPIARVANVVIPGALSEAAGEAAQGTPYEGAARMGAAVAGSLGVGGVQAIAGGGSERLISRAARGATPGHLADAMSLMEEARRRGLQITPAEAIQQVTGGATGMGRLQRVVEGTREGSEALAPMFAQRPQQVRQAVTNLADAIAPPTQNPSMIGPQAQGAAQGGLDTVRQHINAQAQPSYAALAGQSLPDADFAGLQADPSFARALASLRGNAELNGPIAHLPDNDLSVLNEVTKQLDTDATAARQTAMNPKGNNYLSSLRGDARQRLDAAASTASPDWRQARDTVSQGRAQLLDPLEAGPTGAIARTDQVPQQTGALYPAKPLEGAANETAQAMQVLGPQVGGDLTRQHLINSLNGATKDLQGGANQWGGAKLAAAIAGTPEQSAVLNAGVRGVNPAAADQLDPLLEALRATGKREPAGSKTAFNAQDLAEFKRTPAAVSVAANPMKWPSAIADAATDWQYRRNVGDLAQLLQMGPDEAAAALDRARSGEAQRRAALATALVAGIGLR